MSTREQELLRQVEGILAETQRDADRAAREDAERDEERAAAARAGRLGPDWRAVQRRIDAAETSLAEVFGGSDQTPSAVRLRDQSRATIEAMELPDEIAEEIAALREAMP